MGEQLDFIFGIHCHQPVGNFPQVIEEAYRKAYKPFIDILERHPAVKMVLHYTGPLLEFFEEQHPEFLERIKKLVARGQAELLGGGFYEPILTVVPEDDALGQLALLSQHLEEILNQRTEGIWLAERVWEPQLPSLLAEAGIKYLALDDSHFRRAGLEERELFGYYLTEDRGEAVGAFPISAKLRYLIPFREVERTLEYFKQALQEEERPLLTLVDDGEKFGVWPGTHDWVYKDGWLDRFFKALERNTDWIKTWTMHEYFAKNGPRGLVYFPTGSYFELTEWALPLHAGLRLTELERLLGERLEEYRPLIAGGYWRNFLSKYPEGNYLHKRMLRTSRRLKGLEELSTDPKLEAARRELYRGQSNDAYWHGLFGGIYLPHLRNAVYKHLIAAEVCADRLEHPNDKSWAKTAIEDLDADLEPEIVVETEHWFACFKKQGGMLLELDDKEHRFNVLNTIARREEVYHREVAAARTPQELTQAEESERQSIHELKLAKQAGLEKFLIYDRYRRGALLDHFLRSDTTRTRFIKNEYEELGGFLDGIYAAEYGREGAEAWVQLQREGSIKDQSVSLLKRARFHGDVIWFSYKLINRSQGSEPLQVRYGMEFNLALLAGDAPDRYILIDGARPQGANFAGSGEHRNIKKIELINEYDHFIIELELNRETNLWRFPVYTVNNSEAGFELVYQETVLLFWWDLQLDPGDEFSFEIDYRIREL